MRRAAKVQIPLDVLVEAQAKAAGWPKPLREFKFHPKRKWRFDYAWPLFEEGNPEFPCGGSAVEIQGGIWNRGKHGRGSGILKDYEKLNAAQALGWRVLQLTPQQVRKGELREWLERMR